MVKHKRLIITRRIMIVCLLVITLLSFAGCAREGDQDLLKSLENNLTQCQETNLELSSEIQRYTTECESRIKEYKECYERKGLGDICQVGEIKPILINTTFDKCIEVISKELITTAGLQGGKLFFENDNEYREHEGEKVNYLDNTWSLEGLESQFEKIIMIKSESCEGFKNEPIDVQIETDEIKLQYDKKIISLNYPLGFLFTKAQNRDMNLMELRFERLRPYPDEFYKIHKPDREDYIFQFFIKGTPLT